LSELKHTVLKDRFGHNSFRELQEEGVDAILEGRDLLMILPTGGGKSLVFQLPTLIKDGISIDEALKNTLNNPDFQKLHQT